ncbi:hypothetical protein V6N12_037456 [Hibiscus sabdariffa]|uniref:Uncharacterized protein n=1 Tax=Hibiscus sabdariffa TaxID=183260 RepID=A0ABR2AUP3_9ROSI
MDVKKLAEHSSTSMEVSLLQYISILRFTLSITMEVMQRQGLGRRALQEFDSMIRALVSVFNVWLACRCSGLVKEGERHFYSIGHKYGLQPGLEHYACLMGKPDRWDHNQAEPKPASCFKLKLARLEFDHI